MLLVVRRKENQRLYPVTKYWIDDVGKAFICCEGWPGEHNFKECCLVSLKENQEKIVNYIFQNPGKSINEIAHHFKIGYVKIFRLVKCLGMEVKADRRKQDKKSNNQLYANTAFSVF